MLNSILYLSLVLAQAAPAKDLVSPIRPFIDESTFIVVRLDPKGDFTHIFNAASTLPWLNLALSSPEDLKEFQLWQAQFTKAGGTDVYLVYGSNDYPNMPCLILVGKNPKDLPVWPVFGTHRELIHNALVVGEEKAVKVIADRKASKRPELETALNSGQGALLHLAFALSAESKKVFEEISPVLPKWAGNQKVEILTQGMRYISWSLGAGEKVPEKLIIKAVNPERAEALKGLGTLTMQGIQQIPLDIRELGDKYMKLFLKVLESHYKPTVKEDEVVIQANFVDLSQELAKQIPFSFPALSLSQNNMKQILLAMHNYESAYGRFPDDIRDKEGKPLLSWRVAILPFIEQEALYKQFKLNEPWDSEHNIKLSKIVVKVYSSPSGLKMEKNKTPYLAIRGKGLFLDKVGGTKITDITDGTSNSIGLVEVDESEAVIWTKPADLQPNQKEPFKGLTQTYKDRILAAFLDGSVRTLPIKLDPKNLWAMFTIGGGEVIPID
ncbi:MAG: DUF1559 domain-containing protein [Gemmataceae bacterium]|jgi:hypothetical protein|nr:DUF1559 domain-containing protein [Gemmataceae bacterium]